uniref:Protein-S-isoprenylcysteine O-methyltransferase n=1 Tax=Ganoderma boninense TaxID=34458 RepID=A0A5K1JRD3_9APHY|nr:C-24(28) sterol reductase [Ganoderma boninense]
MSFLAPVLSTPLLKVPLLLGNAAFTYHGMTPPSNPPTAAKEWKRDDTSEDFMSKAGWTHAFVKVCSATTKYIVAGLALAEVSVILARQFPGSPYSARVLDLLGNPTLALTPASAIGALLGAAGGLLRMACHRALGRLFTWELSVRDGHTLATGGPYAVVRHPSYTGHALIACGNIVLLASEGSFFVEAGLWGTGAGRAVGCAVSVYMTLLTLTLFARARQEDVMMRKEFGAQWEEWAERTPWRVVPFVY